MPRAERRLQVILRSRLALSNFFLANYHLHGYYLVLRQGSMLASEHLG